MAESVGDLVARVLLDSKNFDDAIVKLRSGMDDLQAKGDSLSIGDKIQAAGPAILGVGAALSGVSAGFGLVAKEAVTASEGLTKAKIGFTTMLGSAEKADAMLRDLQKFAATTPFEFPDLVSSAQKMKALGFEANQIVPTLRTVGDTAAAMGKGKESIDLIVLALGQMASKGKVSAQEMNQLAEQGIGGWEMLAKSIGVSIPEAMKLAEKGLIDGKQAQAVLLAGMNEQFAGNMDKLSKTLSGQWSNFKDTITAALLPIGSVLADALSKAMPLLTQVMEWVKEAATWFGQLPGPIQNTALALAAMLAALGPILTAVGAGIVAWGSLSTALAAAGTTIGALTATILPWAAAIAAAVAALVLLGSWVYDNWDAIAATLTQAWSGVVEMWTAQWNAVSGVVIGIWEAIAGAVAPIWDPIAAFFLAIWDPIASAFTTVWNGIASALSAVWDGIKSAAATVWNGIVSVFQTFLEWAAKIPGAAKLMNLDDAWKSAEKAKTELSKTATATQSVAKAATAAAPKINIATAANTKAAAAANKHAKAVADAWEAAYKRYDKAAKDAEKNLKWFEDSYKKIEKLDRDIAKSALDLAADYERAHEQMRKASLKTVEIIIPEQKRIPEEVQKAIRANEELEQSYKDLGLKSPAEFDKQYKAAKDAYDKITAAGKAAPEDIDRAWIEMETRRQAAVVAHGGVVEAEHKKTLDRMKEQLNTSKTEQEGEWRKFGTEVSTIITNTVQSISKDFFSGDLSWGEKMKSMFSSLGQAAMSTLITPLTSAFNTFITDTIKDLTDTFLAPATKALSDFMTGTLKDLMGGEGFGGIKKGIEDAGAAFKRIFGKGGEAATDAADLGSIVTGGGSAAGSGGGGAGGAAGAAAGGLAGIVTAVASVATAISSIIGNFQMAKMETSLNAIEHNTRYSMMFLGERSDGGILSVLFRIHEQLEFGNLVRTLEDFRNKWWDNTGVVNPLLDTIATATSGFSASAYTSLQVLEQIRDRAEYHFDVMSETLRDVADSFVARSIEVKVTATGVTTKEAATALGNQIASNLTTQMVGGLLR